MTHYEDIAYTVDNGVARITISRSSKLNAVRVKTAEELLDAINRAENTESVRAMLITGGGRAFSSGFDLSMMNSDAPPDLEAIVETFNVLIMAMRSSPLPIVSAVGGTCAGVGVGMALAADIVIAARSAYFLEPFVALALVPDGGSTYFLTRQAGRARASGMMLLGDKVSAEHALSWGLLWDVVDDEALDQTALSICQKLISRDPAAVSGTKQLIRSAELTPLSTQLKMERDAQGVLGRAPAMMTKIKAFLDR